MSSPDLSQPGDPSDTAPAIELETVTARQEEDTEASSAESDKGEAKPTSKYKLELFNPQ